MVVKRASRVTVVHVFVAVVWLVTCFHGVYCVKIAKLVVPEIVQYGVHDSVILDCDYTYGNETPGLVIKWFFKDKVHLVYQWIVGQKPQGVGILRRRLDINYKASDDPLTMYRAMRIVKLDTDLTGEYTCVVSTFLDEDFKGKPMTVFVPESNFRLIQNKTDDNTVNVICAADGAYPEPNLTIGTPEKHLTDVDHRVTTDINGRYSVVASVTLNDADLPTPAEFICTLRIPQAKYAVRKEAIYYPGPITTPEMPTAADMQLAAGVTLKGPSLRTILSMALLTLLARILVS